jgi:hypothetical protein
MQTREYFQDAHRYLKQRRRMRSVQVKCHDIESSLLEGVFARGDRRMGPVIERAWQYGARLDAWSEKFQPALWWQALEEEGIDAQAILHQRYPLEAQLPWDHIGIRQGRGYLEQEQNRSLAQLADMRCGVAAAP